MNHDSIPKYFGICFIVCLLGGLSYGLYHDFTLEYKAAHPIQYEMVVYDVNGNETTIGDIRHERFSQNYRIAGNVVIPLTPLDEHGLKIQKEDGCIACHDRK